MMGRIVHYTTLAAILLLLVTLTDSSAARTAGPPSAVVTVLSKVRGTMVTQLSTNNVWSGMLDQDHGEARLKALHAPLVRLHVGDDGYPEAMPEIKKGKWSFAALNALANDVLAAGEQPLMNIKFAPDWMWTCYPHSLGIPPYRQGKGTVADKTFRTFAAYMARLVSYYNKGSMTTESGTVITNPAGTKNRVTYWELWNEPDGDWETPCANPPLDQGITPTQYVTMWNAVTKAMLAVDPSLKFVGPAVANGQFGSGHAYNTYIADIISGAKIQPYAISYHEYGYWDNSVPDKTLFDGDGSDSGSGGVYTAIQDTKAIHAAYPSYPLWITEANVNGAWGSDPYRRPWTALGAAWWGSFFSQLAPLGVSLINQFQLIAEPQFGLLSDPGGTPYLPYWVIITLNHAFPRGSTLLTCRSSRPGILALAARHRDGTISVLLVDRQVNSRTARGGAGLPASVTVRVTGVKPGAVQLVKIDATTSAAAGPRSVRLPASASLSVHFAGYGLAVLTLRTVR